MVKVINVLLIILGFCTFNIVLAQNWVQSTLPQKNQINVSANTIIYVTFNRSILNSSFNSNYVIVRGDISGLYQCSYSYSQSNKTLTINHAQNFKTGESIFITLTSGIKDSAGNNMPSYNFNFHIKSPGGKGIFVNSGNAYNTGMLPYKIISADFNKDNYIDIAVINNGDNSCSIYHNNGYGIFIPAAILQGLYNPDDIAADDIDNDGNIDIVISCQFSNVIRIFKNSGNGQVFQQYSFSSGGQRPFHICICNLNSDGLPDIVVTNWESNLVSFFFNTGNMQFINSANLNVGIRPRPVNFADLDNDGDYDILVGIDWAPAQVVSILNVNGTFVPNYIFNVYDRPYSIEPNDFNNDGLIDFVVSNYYDNKLSVFLNSNQGFFTQSVLFSLGDGARNILSNDFDHDNDIDFSLSASNSNIFSIYKNNGYGFFTPFPYICSWGKSFSHALGDFDNDMDIDIASANQNTNNISIFLNENDVGIKMIGGEIPTEYYLSQNFPNPFNSNTYFHLHLPKSEYVQISLFDVSGKKLTNLHQGFLSSGVYRFDFNADNFNYHSGVIFYRVLTSDFISVKKMIYLK